MKRYAPIELREKRVAEFWRRVERRGPNECWNWLGGLDSKGYGRFGRDKIASRVAWVLANGEQANGCVCHHCDNPRCVNPAHLWLGTQQDNIRDMCAKGRNTGGGKTHCINGHKVNEQNTRWSGGQRQCRICNREAARRYQQRQIARAGDAR